MINIDFTTTSCCRTELLYKTYSSFTKYFKGIDFSKSRLFLNLDKYKRVGSVSESIKVAESFFGDVIYRVNKKPNFSEAVKWCWSRKFITLYVFHLEEDWELLSEVNVDEMISIFTSGDPTIVSVRLRRRERSEEGKNKKVMLCPSLYRRDFLKIHKVISRSLNPEVCIMRPNTSARKWIDKKLGVNKIYSYIFTRASVKRGEQADRLVVDIGREWNDSKGLKHITGKNTRWKI